MSAILGTAVTGAGGGAYTIDNSLRFRASANAYLNRTPTVTGNRRTWTLSSWVKRGALDGRYQVVMFAGDNETDTYALAFDTDNTLNVGRFFSGWTWLLKTSAVYRDPSAWYHFVVAVDTTQATASNRVKIYVNGVQVTAFSTANYPAQNFDTEINSSSFSQRLGYQVLANNFALDGYMAEVNFIDGQALTPSSFGATNASTGVWQPKAYSGSYGTNGFYLKFSDIATTSGSNAGLGKDFSGNANYWNTNNISVTAGITYDAMKDSPTNTSATVGNYATLNPLDAGSQVSVASGNLGVTWSSNSGHSIRATQGMTTGKWYWEVTSGANASIGIIKQSLRIVPSSGSMWVGADGFGAGGSYGYAPNTGNAVTNSVFTSYGTSLTNGDIVGVAFDADNGKIYFSKNGTWQNSGNPATSTNPAFTGIASDVWCPAIGYFTTPTSNTNSFNFGQRPFSYTAPTGFVALNTFNLPTPTVGSSSTTLANKYFDISLWTGNGTSQSITNSGSFQPDFVWYKGRNTTFNNALFDAIRGVLKTLYSNTVGSENTSLGTLTAFNSNGFSVGDDAGANQNTSTYVGWQWNGGGSNATNTSGSITSTVRANTTAGFSIVTYTGTGANATVGHGLGVAPRMILLKQRNGSTYAWNSYHASLGNTYYIQLNTASQADNSVDLWNSTTPTTTVFSLSGSFMNNNGGTYVAYCFAPIAGYSAFGSYTGNGSTDGPFVFTGFRPKFVMFKRTDSSGSWHIFDSSINTYNAATQNLYPNGTNTETANNTQDLLSNGFKCRSTDTDTNASGGTYIYAAFAESPFKYANAR